MRSKTHTLVGGVAFLALSGIVVKVLGLVCKIPLVHVIGEDGMGYFNSAYTIYNLFFMLSNAGLPVAISILISEQTASEDRERIHFVFRRVFLTVCAVGILGALILGTCAGVFSDFVGNPLAEICILVMAPVFLCVCITGGLRGYFQGMSQLVPTGVSQLVEAFVKTLGCVGFAVYAVKKGYSLPICAAFALLGIVIGSFLAMTYLWILCYKQGAFCVKKKRYLGAKDSTSAILKRLFLIAFPVTVGSLVVSLSNFLDLTVIMRGLQSSGMSSDLANRAYGNYTGLAVPLFNLPPVLIMPIAYATVPSITAARMKNDKDKITMLVSGALKAACLITLPCVFGLFFLSEPILLVLFEKQAAVRAAPLLSILGPSVFFVGIVTVTGSVLQSCGKQFVPVISMLCGAVFKLIVSLVLIPSIGIIAAPIGTLCCYVMIAMMNLVFCMRYCRLHSNFFRYFWMSLVSSFGSTLIGKLIYEGLGSFVSERISTIVSIICVAFLYFVLLLFFRALTREEVMALPIPKFLKKKICMCIPEGERILVDEKCKGIKES